MRQKISFDPELTKSDVAQLDFTGITLTVMTQERESQSTGEGKKESSSSYFSSSSSSYPPFTSSSSSSSYIYPLPSRP